MSVLSFLTDTASSAVLSTTEQSSITTSIITLQSRMALHFDSGVIAQHFRFGSSTRGTILPRSMDEQSDIDYMVVFSDGSATPQLDVVWAAAQAGQNENLGARCHRTTVVQASKA